MTGCVNERLIKRLTAKIGVERCGELCAKVLHEVDVGEDDQAFRATLTADETLLFEEYAVCYVRYLLLAVSNKLHSLRPDSMWGARL